MTMYELEYTNKFKKDLKLCLKRGCDMGEIRTVLTCLERDGFVPPQYYPHKLSGQYNKYWECHIGPDWLLIYDVNDKIQLVSLYRTGTHSDLFG